MIAIGLLVMMYPILCKVKYESLHHVFVKRAIWVQIGFSIIMNWIFAPLLMVWRVLFWGIQTILTNVACTLLGIPAR